ncbi:CYTH domain-containing protein [Lutimaribacter marinistellae]|uniref:CYTH domain-containing protein n=1 Tax=Lutimaribacter marinistellae TaxID=1820329 RepID=A0ABV7TLQ1_9RHOB
MGQEIERKFLVREMPDLAEANSAAIRQGYLTTPGDSVEMRLRQKGARYFLTLKGEGGIVRREEEAEIPVAVFETFWPATEGRRVEKTRHTGALADGLFFELDVFEGALKGLKLVEVEFANETAARNFSPPDWFGEDVSEDGRYKNRALAIDGQP